MTWQEALTHKQASAGSPNIDRALAFQQSALRRMDFIRERMITQEHAVFILQGYYDCIKDFVRALAAVKGFTIYTSMAFTAFLSEVANNAEVAQKLAAVRETLDANMILGKTIPYEKASQAIEISLRIIEDLHSIVKKDIEQGTLELAKTGKLTA